MALRRNSLCMRSSTTFYNRFTWGVSGKNCRLRKIKKAAQKFITRAFMAHFEGGKRMAVLGAVFAGSVLKLHQANLPDTTVIHGDGTTTAAKKGGDNIGFSGHKKVKGDKVVAFCDRNCNVIAPFVSAPGNRNESPLLREALLIGVADSPTRLALDLQDLSSAWMASTIAERNRKAVFNRRMVPNINTNPCGRNDRNEAASLSSTLPFSKNGSIPSSACSAGKISSGDYCCDLNGISQLHYAFKTLAYTMNLRHLCQG